MLAQAEPSIDEEQRWQRAWNKEHVVEPVAYERDVCMWPDDEAIQRIRSAGDQKQGVGAVPKRLHGQREQFCLTKCVKYDDTLNEGQDRHDQ